MKKRKDETYFIWKVMHESISDWWKNSCRPTASQWYFVRVESPLCYGVSSGILHFIGILKAFLLTIKNIASCTKINFACHYSHSDFKKCQNKIVFNYFNKWCQKSITIYNSKGKEKSKTRKKQEKYKQSEDNLTKFRKKVISLIKNNL